MNTPKVKDVADCLERFAPLSYQESYDNSGLLTGQADWLISGVLIALDCTEEVLEEALQKKCNLVIVHHPVIFSGLKKLIGDNYVERTIIKAIKTDIAIYAIHTNIDSVATGVSRKIAERIGLKNLVLLAPKPGTLAQLVSFAPKENIEKITDALYKAGAGQVGKYERCSFQIAGTGTFLPTKTAKPYLGVPLQLKKTEEIRIEVIFPLHLQKDIIEALHQNHPYEEVAYYLIPLHNKNQEVGLGIVGELKKPVDADKFLAYLKDCMNTDCVRHSPTLYKPIQRIAVCGGSGSKLLSNALAHKADAYVSADFKYHDFFEADGKIIIADIGHYESEQFTKDLLKEILDQKFPTFAVVLSVTVTNPIRYS